MSCMPRPITSSTGGPSRGPLSSTSSARPFAWTFTSLEAPLAQPLGRNPLLALDHRLAAMQRAGRGMRPLVAEEDRVALAGRDFQVHVGKHGAAALFRLAQVHDQRAHALAAALDDGRRTGLGGIEIVVVRLVLGAWAVLEDLQAL